MTLPFYDGTLADFDPTVLASWQQLRGDLSFAEATVIRWKCTKIHGCLLCAGVPADLELALMHLLTGPREVMRQILPVATRYLSATMRHYPSRWQGWELDRPKPHAQVEALLLGACSAVDCGYGDPSPDHSVLQTAMITLMSACALQADADTLKIALKLAVRVWDACRDYDSANMPRCLVSHDAIEGWRNFILTALQAGDPAKPSKGVKWAVRLLERWLAQDTSEETLVTEAFSQNFGLIMSECVRFGSLKVLRLVTELELLSEDIPCSSLIDLAMRKLGVSDAEEMDWEEDFVAVCRAEPNEAFLCVQEWSQRDPNNAAVALCWAKVEGSDVSLNLPPSQELIVALEVCRASCPLPHALEPHKARGVKLLTRHDNKYVRHRAWLLLAALGDSCEFVKDVHVPVNLAATFAGCTSLEVALEIGELCCDYDIVAEALAKCCDNESLVRVIGLLSGSFETNPSAETLAALAQLLASNYRNLGCKLDAIREKIVKVHSLVFSSQELFLTMPTEAILFAACVNVPGAFTFLFHYYMGGHSAEWQYTQGCNRTEICLDSYIAALCGSMSSDIANRPLAKIAQMVLMVSRKLLGLGAWVPLDPRYDPIVDESHEKVPHWGGCLLLEHFGTVFARQNQRLPADIQTLITQTLENTQFAWAAFRASIACGILHENLWRSALQDQSSSLRQPVFLYAITVVLEEYPMTLTTGSPWTWLVLQTSSMFGRRKRGRDEGNDYDDWHPARCFAFPWTRIGDAVSAAITTLVSRYQAEQAQQDCRLQQMDVSC